MNDKVKAVLGAAQRFHLTARAEMKRGQFRKNDLRTLLMIAQCNLVLEHHHSITFLLDIPGHEGSSLALWRPVYEGRARAIWLSQCATNAQAEAINTGKAFPRYPDIMQALSHVLKNSAGEGLERNKKEEEFRHGLTHGGIEQLQYRYDDQGLLNNDYPDELISALIEDTTACALNCAQTILQELDRPASFTRLAQEHEKLFGPCEDFFHGFRSFSDVV